MATKKNSVPVICVTTDYSQFKHLSLNREVKKNKALRASIERNGLLPYYPIVVTPNMEIIDGQHRLATLMAIMEERKAANPETENLPVYYVIDERINAESGNAFIAQAILDPNITSNNWDGQAYLNSYVQQNIPVYKEFDEVTKELPFSGFGNRMVIFSAGKTSAKKFKEGKLQGNKDFYKEVVNFLLEASCPLNGRTPFLQAIVAFFVNFKEKLNKEQWSAFSEKLASQEVEQTSREAYLKTFLKLAGYTNPSQRNKFYNEVMVIK